MSNWSFQLSKSIRNLKDLPKNYLLKKSELDFFKDKNKYNSFPFCVTPYYFSLADPSDSNDPIRKQFLPDKREFIIKNYEAADPLSEKKHEASPRLIHQYKNRVLLRVTDICAVYCRHCYRRYMHSDKNHSITEAEADMAVRYIKNNSNIAEVLLSGGDPLVLGDKKIINLVRRIRSIRKDLLIRLCSRAPVVIPQRITFSLIGKLKEYKPLWFVTQFNHPTEISRLSAKAVSIIVNSGIPVLNQTVLLKGINDNISTLSGLFSRLTRLQVKPYYLFQGDLAMGTSHFRVPLEAGLALYRELCRTISTVALPVYSLDLPDGGGKIQLSESFIKGKEGGWFLIKDLDGKLFRYPAE